MGDRVGPAAALHPCDVDRTTGAQNGGFVAHQAEIAQTIKLIVVRNPSRAIAKSNLCADIEADFGSALVRPAVKRLALAPFVHRERPPHFGPGRIDRRRRSVVTYGKRWREKRKRTHQSTHSESNSSSNDYIFFHCVVVRFLPVEHGLCP